MTGLTQTQRILQSYKEIKMKNKHLAKKGGKDWR